MKPNPEEVPENVVIASPTASKAILASIIQEKIHAGQLALHTLAAHDMGQVCMDRDCEVQFVLVEVEFPTPSTICFVTIYTHKRSTLPPAHQVTNVDGPFLSTDRQDLRPKWITAFDALRPEMDAYRDECLREKAQRDRKTVGPAPSPN